MTDQFDDDTEAEVATTGVPPAPSVTPGPNPPPPASAIDEAAEQRGCVAVLIVGAVLAIIALVLAIVLVVIGLRIFGESDESANAKILQEVYSETGISSTTGDAVHPPQRERRLRDRRVVPHDWAGQHRRGIRCELHHREGRTRARDHQLVRQRSTSETRRIRLSGGYGEPLARRDSPAFLSAPRSRWNREQPPF